jgi:hypothetical protein
MPSRSARLARARVTLRRRFGESRSTSPGPSHRLRDLGSAYPLFGGTRVVTGDEIEEALQHDITTINSPVLQGWSAGFLIAAIAATIFLTPEVRSVALADGVAIAVATLALPFLTWLGSNVLWGLGQETLELDERGVRVRRWSSFGRWREGRVIGLPADLRARLESPDGLVIEGPGGAIRVSLRSWRPSARAELVDELPLWGVACAFGAQPSRRRRQREGRGPGRGRRSA